MVYNGQSLTRRYTMTDKIDNQEPVEKELTERECKVLDLAELITECASDEDLIENYYNFQLYYYNSLTDEELDAELQWVSDILDEDNTEEDNTEEVKPTIH
jgi:hypothetical protein